MGVKKKTYYECPQCGTEHESKSEAKQCCPLEFEKRSVFVCDYCEEEYDTRSEAKDCCEECDECGELVEDCECEHQKGE